MPPALSPTLALEYVHELSADVRAGAILDAAGELLAGAAEIADPARALLGAAGDAGEVEAATADGVVCAVRTSAHAGVAVCGRFALPGVVRQDLRAALAALEGRAPEPRAVAPDPLSDDGELALAAAANRLITAVQRQFGA